MNRQPPGKLIVNRQQGRKDGQITGLRQRHRLRDYLQNTQSRMFNAFFTTKPHRHRAWDCPSVVSIIESAWRPLVGRRKLLPRGANVFFYPADGESREPRIQDTQGARLRHLGCAQKNNWNSDSKEQGDYLASWRGSFAAVISGPRPAKVALVPFRRRERLHEGGPRPPCGAPRILTAVTSSDSAAPLRPFVNLQVNS